MGGVVEIKGFGEVMQALKALQPRASAGMERGLKKAGLYLQRKSMEIVPVQFGVLKASAFSRKTKGQGFSTEVTVGYTAKYALFVHENLDAAHGAVFNVKYADIIADPNVEHTVKSGWFNRGENQQAKFLEKPFREEAQMIFNMVTHEVEKTTLKKGGA